MAVRRGLALAGALVWAAGTSPSFAQDEQPRDAEPPSESLAGEPASPPPSILAILAHPDDEITIAPVLARAARDGAPVRLVFATSGDQGPGVSDLAPGEELAQLRSGEGRCAAFALGLDEPVFWGLGDGTLGEMPRAPDSPSRRLLGLVAEMIAKERPQVVMTWGPDGGYGHGDHRMVSAAVTQVVQGMDEGRPDLIYSAIPSESRPEMPEFEAWATTNPDLITDRLHYEPQDLQATRIAIDCYESQFSAEVRAGLADLLHRSIWRGTVHFRLAFPQAF